ncbi:unnamed protein product, partial [Nesidiocoris tenuis]
MNMTTAIGTEGERAALVSERGLYSESNGKAVNDDEENGVIGKIPNGSHQPKPHNILGQFHEDALTQVGVGSYQWLMCATAGFCFMADGVQVFISPFLENSVQAEMCVGEEDKPWISGVAMLGLFFGAILCSLADHVGRRPMLLFGLSLHLMFSIITAATPTIGLFMLSRFMASLGLGICYPVSCIYFAEFLPQNARGRISFLLLFWALGGFYVILFAGALLPASADEMISEVKEHQNAWHRVLLLSLLPSIFAFISLIFCSESVRYMLHTGRDVNAIMMYQQMYKWNASRSAQYQLTELELPSKVSTAKPSPDQSICGRFLHFCAQVLFPKSVTRGMRQFSIPPVRINSRFIQDNVTLEAGRVNQTLSGYLEDEMQDFFQMVADTEERLANGTFTLAAMWSEVQGHMKKLSILHQIVNCVGDSRGGATLTALHESVTLTMADETARQIFYHATKEASVPFFETLSKWIYCGVIDDLYKEFMIVEKAKRKTPSNWDSIFVVNDDYVPSFLKQVVGSIHGSGKYLDAIRKSLSSLEEMPSAPRQLMEYNFPEQSYLAHIQSAYKFANYELLERLIVDRDIISRLTTYKACFTLEYSDLFNNIIENCSVELKRPVDQMCQSYLPSLIDLCIQTSSMKSLKYIEDLTVHLEKQPLHAMEMLDYCNEVKGGTKKGTSQHGGGPEAVSGLVAEKHERRRVHLVKIRPDRLPWLISIQFFDVGSMIWKKTEHPQKQSKYEQNRFLPTITRTPDTTPESDGHQTVRHSLDLPPRSVFG